MEYLFGINGNIPVSKFSKAGKRKNKHKISLRMKVVKAVKLLLPRTPAINTCEWLEEIVYKFEDGLASCLCEIGRELKATPFLPKYFTKYPM